MSSFSPPPCRTSRRWRSDYSGNHPAGGAHRLPEMAHASVSRVRLEVAANQAAAKPNSRLISARSKPLTGITPDRKTYFLNSIDPSQTSAQRGGRTVGPATSVTNGAFDADPTRASRNNGLQCSPTLQRGDGAWHLLGRSLYISRLLRGRRTRRDGYESVSQACSHPGRRYRRL